jgi:hypothetical protein
MCTALFSSRVRSSTAGHMRRYFPREPDAEP